MPADQDTKAAHSSVARSSVTNGKDLQLFGDQRSAGARRFRDLVKAFGAEVGGLETLPASAQQSVRRLAQVSVELELLEAQRASGQAIDPVAFVTLVNTQRRLLRDLEALKKQHAATKTSRPALHDYLASKSAETGAA